MPDLFGLNIAGIVNSSIQSAGGVRNGSFDRITPGTRTPGNVTGGTNPTETTHRFSGFTETKQQRRAESTVSEPVFVVSILGASIRPATTPKVGDVVTLDGTDIELLELLNLDPATALYEFRGS